MLWESHDPEGLDSRLGSLVLPGNKPMLIFSFWRHDSRFYTLSYGSPASVWEEVVEVLWFRVSNLEASDHPVHWHTFQDAICRGRTQYFQNLPSLLAPLCSMETADESKSLGSGYSDSSGSKETLGCSHGASPQYFQTLPRSLHTSDMVGSYGNHVIWLAWGERPSDQLGSQNKYQEAGHGSWILCQTQDWYFVTNDNSTHFSTQKIEPLSIMLFVTWVPCKITSDTLLLHEQLLWKSPTQTMWHSVPRLISHDFFCYSSPHHNSEPNKRSSFFQDDVVLQEKKNDKISSFT